jgi:predicted RNA-binding protein Jag
MPGQRFEGHNLEEAIDAAASALGVPRYQVVHKVVVEKRGFLGGLKRVVIEAHVDPEASEPPPPPVERAARPAAADRPRPRQRSDRPDRDRGGRGGGRGRDHSNRERPYERHSRWSEDDRPYHEELPPQGEQSEGAAAVAKWADDLFELAGFALEARTNEDDEQILVTLYGRDGRLMVDRDGELLEAMQTIAAKALRDKITEKKIEFDCRGFKNARGERLRREARNAADLVRAEGGEQLLEAMNPAERRIVHLELKDDEDVVTVSRGDGFYKRVAIVAKGEDPGSDRQES